VSATQGCRWWAWQAGWPVILTGWPLAGWRVTVGVVEVGVVDKRYGVSQPGADAERYRCVCLHCTHGGWLGVVTGISAASSGGILVISERQTFKGRPDSLISGSAHGPGRRQSPGAPL